MGFFLLWLFFGIGIILQLIYLLIIFGRTAWFKPNPKTGYNQVNQEGVTVLIAARNEYGYLKTLIPKLFEQEYPEYEVMVVNDRSTDRTKRLLEDMMQIYPKLRTVTIQFTTELVTSKKYALTLGIKVAKNDVLLLTDADCMPNSNQWIRKMTEAVRLEGKTFGIGYSGYLEKSSVLNSWIQFETILTALFYLSFGLWKAPLIGIGRNLCYRKSFFLEVNAFKGLWKLQGGDDDLFVNKYVSGKNSAIIMDPEASTLSEPKEAWKDYLKQKKRHLNTGKYYKKLDQQKIGFFAISHALFWIGGLGLLFYFGFRMEWEQFSLIFGIIVLRFSLLTLVFRHAAKTIQGKVPKMNPILNDLLYLGYFWVWGSVSYKAKNIQWK